MRGLAILVGILLMVVAFAALFLIILLPTMSPENPLGLSILETLVCDPGHKAEVRVVVTHDSDGTGYTPQLTCIGREGERTDASAKHLIVGLGTFLVPFLIGLFMVIAGAQRAARNAQRPQTQWKEGSVPETGFGSGFATARANRDTNSNASATLKAKLKELEDARASGLITREEFEKLRQEILDKLV